MFKIQLFLHYKTVLEGQEVRSQSFNLFPYLKESLHLPYTLVHLATLTYAV